MAQHQQMRIREALIPLFLRHPDFANQVPHLIKKLSANSAFTLSHLYTAAVYLQSLWRGQLELYLSELNQLPNYFGSSQWGLPDTSVHYDEARLRLLAQKVYAHVNIVLP